MNKIIGYKNTINLGDAIQSIALYRYLISKNIDIDKNIIFRQNLGKKCCANKNICYINGWHRKKEELLPNKAIFISLHADTDHLSKVDKSCFVGCRDSWTLDNCRELGLRSIITGCVTITFESVKVTKTAKDIIFVDSTHERTNPDVTFTQKIPENLSWLDQLLLAKQRLELLSKAALVHTKRLHILLPCIAMGIPVVLDRIPFFQPERFSFFLDFIPVNKPIERNSGIREQLIEIWNNNSTQVLGSTTSDPL